MVNIILLETTSTRRQDYSDKVKIVWVPLLLIMTAIHMVMSSGSVVIYDQTTLHRASWTSVMLLKTTPLFTESAILLHSILFPGGNAYLI